jgi:hypothetical protein
MFKIKTPTEKWFTKSYGTNMCGHMTTAETSNSALSVNNIKLIIIKYANECNKIVWHLSNILFFQCTEILGRQTAIIRYKI